MKYFTKTFFLCLITLFFLINCSKTNNPKIGGELEAEYLFAGDASDNSGNNYDGTLLGNSSANGFLQIGDNNVDRLSLPYEVMDGLRDFSFSAWLKVDVIHTTPIHPAQTWISGAREGEDNAILIMYRDFPYWNKIWWEVKLNETTYDLALDSTLHDLEWHYVVVLREGGIARLYIDGEQVGSDVSISNAQLALGEGGLIIGQEQDAVGGDFDPTQSWAGKIDEFRIHNYALNEDEIDSLYTVGHDTL
jgi:MSHA biogenesis protein MshQ